MFSCAPACLPTCLPACLPACLQVGTLTTFVSVHMIVLKLDGDSTLISLANSVNSFY